MHIAYLDRFIQNRNAEHWPWWRIPIKSVAPLIQQCQKHKNEPEKKSYQENITLMGRFYNGIYNKQTKILLKPTKPIDQVLLHKNISHSVSFTGTHPKCPS